MTDPKKTTGIQALTRPESDAREKPPTGEQEWDGRSLPLGIRVGEFEITGIIGKGGFGIVYLAWDHSLDRVIALKEYMPVSFASRTNRMLVSPLSERHRETFEFGLRSFVNEAKLLAQFHSPSLLEVHRFWEENGTAYMAMPYYRGSTLGEKLRSFSEPPSEAWLKDLLAPLTEALMELHSVQCYHRDVAPDNILILADTGSPVLLDFGAARRVIAGEAHALTVILKAGYAPIEQYGELPGMEQGPWTDVYALASVVYWAVTGKTPPAATTRMIRDTYVPLADSALPNYSREFLEAIDRALVVAPLGRTESIAKLRSELGLVATTQRGRTRARWADPDATVLTAPPPRPPPPPPPTNTAAVPAAADSDDAGHKTGHQTSESSGAHKPRRLGLAAGAAALLIAAAAGIWWFKSGPDVAPPPKIVAGPVSPEPKRPAPAPPVVVKPEPTPTAQVSIPVPRSARDALDLILAKKNPDIRLAVVPPGPEARRGARRTLDYSSSEQGYLYLLAAREGGDELTLLLPAAKSRPGRSAAKGKLTLPADSLKPGKWRVLLASTQQPLELPLYGWIVEGSAWKLKYGQDTPRDASNLLPWDIPSCAAGDQGCKSAYGAAEFELEIGAVPPVESPGRVTADTPRPDRKTAPPKAAVNPECEKILMRLSLGEAAPELIERMKTLKCN